METDEIKRKKLTDGKLFAWPDSKMEALNLLGINGVVFTKIRYRVTACRESLISVLEGKFKLRLAPQPSDTVD